MSAVCHSTYAEYLSPPVWKATKRTLLEGKLVYKGESHRVAPGLKPTFKATNNFIVWSAKDIFNTFYKSPEVLKTVYNSGLVENFIDYKKMVSNNWKYSKLSSKDFSQAKEAYIREGNWGIFQTLYYSLKGTSRIIWSLAILNSAEAVYKIGEAGVETVYYVLRYPVKGTFEGVSAPVVFVVGSVWSTSASLVTTGWGLPFTGIADTGIFVKESL